MDGFINLDKDSGISSHQAVAAIRRLLNCKTGHAGTLDPLATGVLPLCLGKATRLAEYITGREKSYLARVCFGVETDSYDAAGAIISQKGAAHLCMEDISALTPRFLGRIQQKPPVISAIKRGGLPLYKRARRGEIIEVETRSIEIYSIKIVDGAFGSPQPYVDIFVSCGKGVYIRSLAHDMGELLGTGAHLASLRRLSVGAFRVEQSYTLAQIEELLTAGDMSFLLPLRYGLSHLPSYIAPDEAFSRLLHGNDWPLTVEREQTICQVETVTGALLGIGNINKDRNGGYVLKMNKVLADADDKQKLLNPTYSVVAIGNFDGVHLGHKQLLRRMILHKERLGGASAVLSFEPHPLQLVKGQTPLLLNTTTEKRRLILQAGIDALINLPFDQSLMNSSPRQFVEDIIIKRFAARQVVVGFNFRFGAGGSGNAGLLKQLCAAYDIDVEIVDAVSSTYGVISSSNIRSHLLAGDMQAVRQMLGYWYEMSGEVIAGRQLGRKLGFPTANFLPPAGKALPLYGVYAVSVEWQGRLYDGVANFGYKPTISGGDTQPLLEAHLFDADLDIYGELITVRFGSFLRPEKQFADIHELTAQIAIDIQAARQIIK